MRDKLVKLKDLIKNAISSAYHTVKDFIKGCYEHWETTAILVLSAIGISSLLGELPFYLTLPMWIEAPMIIPLLGVLLILFLLWNADRRNNQVAA